MGSRLGLDGSRQGEPAGFQMSDQDQPLTSTRTSQLFRLGEQSLKDSFSTLYQRNLYTLAIGLAQSRGVGPEEVAEIYRRWAAYTTCASSRRS